MSSIFFCYACGHSLTHISGPRMKCYGCNKYFAFSYDEERVCPCHRTLPAFKYSVEIFAPNKGKCLCCKKEMEVVGNLEEPYLDSLAERAGRELNAVVRPFKTADHRIQKTFERKSSSQEKRKIEFEPDIFDEKDRFLIVGDLPLHQSIDEIAIEIGKGTLSIKSLLPGIDFKKDLALPENVVLESRKATTKNGILEISFSKNRNQT